MVVEQKFPCREVRIYKLSRVALADAAEKAKGDKNDDDGKTDESVVYDIDRPERERENETSK